MITKYGQLKEGNQFLRELRIDCLLQGRVVGSMPRWHMKFRRPLPSNRAGQRRENMNTAFDVIRGQTRLAAWGDVRGFHFICFEGEAGKGKKVTFREETDLVGLLGALGEALSESAGCWGDIVIFKIVRPNPLAPDYCIRVEDLEFLIRWDEIQKIEGLVSLYTEGHLKGYLEKCVEMLAPK